MSKVDPRLTQALTQANGSGARVQAVLTLRSKDPARPLAPAQTRESVRTIIEKAERKTRRKSKDVVVFANLQSFSIDADAGLILEILTEDAGEIDSALLNARGG